MKPIFLENNFLGKNWKGERKYHLGLGVTNSVEDDREIRLTKIQFWAT